MSNTKEAIDNKYVAFNIFVFFVAIYLLTSSVVNMEQFDVGLMRSEVAKAFIERFDLNVPTGTGIVGIDGRDYSWFSPGSVLLALPLYAIAHILNIPSSSFLNIVNPMFSAGTAVLMFLFFRYLGYTKRPSVFMSIIYGLGTMAWYYSKDPGDHAIETFFALLTVFCMYRFLQEEKYIFLTYSGVCLGISFLVRPTSIFIALPLFLMTFAKYLRRESFWEPAKSLFVNMVFLILVLVPFISIFFAYNNYRFGSYLESGYSLYAARAGLDFFKNTQVGTGLMGLIVSPGKGYFYYSPITVLFFFSIGRFWKRDCGLALCCVSTILIYILYFSRYVFWHGDWAWGPRFLFVLTPFFVLPVVEIFERDFWIKSKITRSVVYRLVFLSFSIQIISVSIDPYKYFYTIESEFKVPFSVVEAEGIQRIREPVVNTYFKWKLSPIYVQGKLLFNVLFDEIESWLQKGFFERRNSRKTNSGKETLDFWWLHKYSSERQYSGFIVSGLLLITAIICLYKINCCCRLIEIRN